MDASQIGKRAWSYAGVLMNAGLSNVEYVEQLTMLLFLKMADQFTEPPYNREPIVPADLGWQSLMKIDGLALEEHYQTILTSLGTRQGMLGVIFKNARNEIRNPALLKQLIVNLIDKENWVSLPVDVKGAIYEELLQRSAAESTKGAGQYFTTRAVIQAICDLKRDKLSLDLFWIKDKSLTDTDSLPPPDILASEIADDLQAALEMFQKIAARLNTRSGADSDER